MKKKDHRLLERLGLTPHESAVYLSLVDHGPATISQLSHATGIHRALVYKTIPVLTDHELVTTILTGKRTKFIAEPPERLHKLFHELSGDMEKFLPELEERHRAQGSRPLVKFIEGQKGIRTALEDVTRTLKRGEVYYRYSSRKETTGYGRYTTPAYKKLRDEKQLQRFVITSESLNKTKPPRLDRAVKIVPSSSGLFDYNIAEIIYANKVLYLDYNTETALLIENPMIAEFQKKLFKLLYDKL